MKLPFSVFIVSEESMLPTFKPGNHVVTFNWAKPKVGDVVVFFSSSLRAKRNNLFYIKRIVIVNRQKIYVRGDNRVASKLMGAIKSKDIIGRVIFKY